MTVMGSVAPEGLSGASLSKLASCHRPPHSPHPRKSWEMTWAKPHNRRAARHPGSPLGQVRAVQDLRQTGFPARPPPLRWLTMGRSNQRETLRAQTSQCPLPARKLENQDGAQLKNSSPAGAQCQLVSPFKKILSLSTFSLPIAVFRTCD